MFLLVFPVCDVVAIMDPGINEKTWKAEFYIRIGSSCMVKS